MWCVYKGHVCVMVFEKSRSKWVYIRERKWLAMTGKELEQYEW